MWQQLYLGDGIPWGLGLLFIPLIVLISYLFLRKKKFPKIIWINGQLKGEALT